MALNDLGDIPLGTVIPIHWPTYSSVGASVTMTGLAVTDIEVYKDTSMVQRASDSGYALLETDGTDLDGVAGVQGISLDTGDNTTAGFWAAGSLYNVWVIAVTIDGQTVHIHLATFTIVPARNVAGIPIVDALLLNGIAVSVQIASMVDQVFDEDMTGHQTQGTFGQAIGDPGADADTIYALVNTIHGLLDTEIAAILAAVDTEIAAILSLITTNLDAAMSSRSSQASQDVIDARLDTEIPAILARLPTSLSPDGFMPSDLQSIKESLTAAANLERSTRTMVLFTVGVGSTQGSVVVSSFIPASSADDQFNGRFILFPEHTTTASLRGQGGTIQDYNQAGLTFTLAQNLTTAPQSGDIGIVI